MKTKDGFIQGYNAQAAVDAEHQIIVSCDLTNQVDHDSHYSSSVPCLAGSPIQPLNVQRVYIDCHWRSDFRRLDAAVYLAADGSTAGPGRPGLGQHVIVVLVVGELDLMKHSERLSIAAKPNDVLA